MNAKISRTAAALAVSVAFVAPIAAPFVARRPTRK